MNVLPYFSLFCVGPTSFAGTDLLELVGSQADELGISETDLQYVRFLLSAPVESLAEEERGFNDLLATLLPPANECRLSFRYDRIEDGLTADQSTAIAVTANTLFSAAIGHLADHTISSEDEPFWRQQAAQRSLSVAIENDWAMHHVVDPMDHPSLIAADETSWVQIMGMSLLGCEDYGDRTPPGNCSFEITVRAAPAADLRPLAEWVKESLN